jgi:hypothetical protein
MYLRRWVHSYTPKLGFVKILAPKNAFVLISLSWTASSDICFVFMICSKNASSTRWGSYAYRSSITTRRRRPPISWRRPSTGWRRPPISWRRPTTSRCGIIDDWRKIIIFGICDILHTLVCPKVTWISIVGTGNIIVQHCWNGRVQ